MFDTYMDELKKIKILSPHEEHALWKAYKENDSGEARNKLIEQYQLIVFREAQRFYGQFIDDMELVQEGTVGLIESVERYDYTKGIAFSVYAAHRIRGRMLDYLRKEGKRDILLAVYKEEQSPWWEQLPTEDVSTEFLIEEQAYREQIAQTVENLSPSERLVMEKVCMQGQSVKSVATTLATSQSYIYRLQRQGLKKLRALVGTIQKEWDEL